MGKRNKPLLTISINNKLLEKIIEIGKKENINRSTLCEKLLYFSIKKYDIEGITLLNNSNTKGLKKRVEDLEKKVKDLEAFMQIEMKTKKYENKFYYRKGFGKDLAYYITKKLEKTENPLPYKKIYMWLGKNITLKNIKTFTELSNKIKEIFDTDIKAEELKTIYSENE